MNPVASGVGELNVKINKKAVFVSMSNLLIRSSHGLSIAERRILMLAISQIETGKRYTGNPVFRIYAADIVKLSGVTPSTAYNESRSAQERLYKRSITLLHDIHTGDLLPGSLRWITKAHYQKSEGWLEVALNHDLLPYVSELSREFTSYDHNRTGGFRSIYSHRVFDLLMQFKRTGSLKIKVDDFADAVEAPPSMRANFANMRQRIINPALKEIKEKDGLDVGFTVKKAGRKVTGLEFTFSPEQQKTLPLQQPKKARTLKIDKAYIEQHARPGETYETARIRLEAEKRRDKTAA